MRNFIKDHTPEWWDGWCWFALGMIVWCLGWAVFGTDPAARGLQAGMSLYWVGFLIYKAIAWMDNDLLRIYRQLNELNNKIIARQRETIALKNKTIRVQNDHINYLKGQR